MEDFYQVLGLQRGASADEIKKAYKKLALQFHPDRGGGNEEMFKRVSEAHEVLSDPSKRKLYDTHGKAGLEQGFVDPSEMFASMFGGARPQQARSRQVELAVTLEEVYTGKIKTVDVKRRVIDQSLVSTCSTCEGRGCSVHVQSVGGMMFQQALRECMECHGVGSIVPDHAVSVSDQKISVNIPPGCPAGSRIVAHGLMDDVPGQASPGDIVFVVSYRSHDVFHPLPNGDLQTILRINLFEALTGFTRILRHLDGSFIRVSRQEVTQPSSKWTVLNEGLKRHTHLHCLIEVKFPTEVHTAEDNLSAILNQQKHKQRLSNANTPVKDVTLGPYKEPSHQQRQHQTHQECVQQ